MTSPPHDERLPLAPGLAELPSIDPRCGLLNARFAWLLGVQITFGFVFSGFLLLPKYLVTVHQAGADVIGLMSGAALFSSVATVPLMGFLLARVSRGGLIVLGALLGAAAALGFATLEAVGPLMLGLRLVQGFAFALVVSAGGTLVTDLVPTARLGQALGYWGLAMLVTNAIAPAVLEPIADRYGFTPVFALIGVASLMAAGLGAVIALDAPLAKEHDSGPAGRLFERRRLVVFGVAALMGTGLGTMFTFVQPFALERGMTTISGFFIAYTIAAIGARVGLGGLADRFGRAGVSALALLVYGASVVTTGWLSSNLVVVVAAGLGIAHGIAYPALNALAVEDAGPRLRGSVMAYYNGAFNVGFAVSVTAFGELAHRAGYPVVFVLAGGLVFLGALGLVGLPPLPGRAPTTK